MIDNCKIELINNMALTTNNNNNNMTFLFIIKR